MRKRLQGDGGNANRLEETHDSAPAFPYRPPLRYYYAGLLSFLIGLGIFSLTMFAGVALWFYMYVQLTFIEKVRKPFWFHVKVILPFFIILAAYLMLRSHFNYKYYYYQVWWVMHSPGPSQIPNMAVVASMPAEFYLTAAQRILPFQTTYYVPLIVLLGLLLAKELAFRWKEVHAPIFWLMLGLMALVISVVGRLPLRLMLSPSVATILEWRLFCYPVATVSIAVGLLLRPPPFLERAISRLPRIGRGLLCAAIVGIFFVLSIGNAGTIKSLGTVKKQDQMKFYQVATQHKASMSLFLHSPQYSSENEFFILNGPLAPFAEFPAGMFVRKNDIFQLYFPHIKNIHFADQKEGQEDEELYVWTPSTVERKNTR